MRYWWPDSVGVSGESGVSLEATLYDSLAHWPKSISLQRSEQNGR